MTVLYESTHRLATPIGGILIFIAIFFIVIGFICLARDDTGLAGVAGIAGIAAVILMFLFFCEPHKRVQVLLDDDYPSVTLYDEYRVIKREGKIWTLDEKKVLEEDEGE